MKSNILKILQDSLWYRNKIISRLNKCDDFPCENLKSLQTEFAAVAPLAEGQLLKHELT
jgi:hypothetical protein